MKLTAWTWIIFGAIITVMSGYIYLFVPKNGQPNNAMALFFFIGIIFIIIGIVNLLFKRVDDKSVFDSVDKSAQKNPEKIIQMPVVESRPNKIDEAINQMANRHIQDNPQARQQQPTQVQAHQAPTHKMMHHTNTYSQLHQYTGPIHNPSTSMHAQHPVSQHIQHDQTHTTSQPHIQNVAEHSIRCRSCGNVNSGHSNYCHQCGNRLR